MRTYNGASRLPSSGGKATDPLHDQSMRDWIAGRVYAEEIPGISRPEKNRSAIGIFFRRWQMRFSCAWSALCGEHDDEYNLRHQ